jgi:ferrous-iron efflux pump FieF
MLVRRPWVHMRRILCSEAPRLRPTEPRGAGKRRQATAIGNPRSFRRGRYVTPNEKASLFAIVGALVLALVKFLVGALSRSMALISSALDSLMDVFMSAMNLFAIRKAAAPADRIHQYGHGKVEDLAAVVQSLVIIGTGAAIILKSLQAFLRGESIAYSSMAIPVMALSLVFSFAISSVLKRVGDRTGSNALKADALHYGSDLYSNSAAIAAILLTFFTGRTYFDLLFAVVTGLIIVVSAVKILRAGIGGLMDTSIPPEVEEKVEELLRGLPPPLAGFHKMRTRMAGSRRYLDFHLLMCRKLSIDEAHAVSEKIEEQIRSSIARIDVIIHIEPCGYDCALNEETCAVLRLKMTGKRV